MENDFLAIPANPNTTASASPALPSVKSSSPPPMTAEGEDMAVEASTTSLLGDVGGGHNEEANNNTGGGGAMTLGVNGLEDDSLQEREPSIDHALLETIFYNEMIAMGDSFSLEGASGVSASVGTVDSNNVGGVEGESAASHHAAVMGGDSSKGSGGDELFQDLDALTRSALPSPPPPSVPPTEIPTGGSQQQQSSPAVWTQQQQQIAVEPVPSQVVQQQQMMPVSTAAAGPPAVVAAAVVAQPQQPAATVPVSSASIPAPIHSQQSETHRAVSFALPQPIPATTTATTPSPIPATAAPVIPTAVPSPTSVAAPTTAPQPQPQQQTQQKAKQLVSQFASLAGRLGISLPPSVLNSLTAAAVINESKQSYSDTATNSAVVANTAPFTSKPASQQSATAKAAPASKAKSKRIPKSKAAPPAISTSDAASSATTLTTVTPVNTTVQRLKDTAAEAVAAIDENRRKRNAPDSSTSNIATESQSPTDSNCNATSETDGIPPAKTLTTNAPTSNRPTQYRRRKKPRLQDCETKLAMLRAENATLKRHLEKFANKSQNFDLERQRAEQNMKHMIEKGEQNPEKLKDVLDKFTEMYSDYGRHREEELDFHLNQLERLAAPTTITKMSLWTLGQDHQFFRHPQRNPIAGILMKELAITPLQARKIIEHRHRIRDLCDNIKQCMALIKRLKSLCKHKQKIFNDRMTKCQEILTPLQVVKLLHWIDEHSGTLESVCPGWGSERIRAGNKAAVDDGKSSVAGAGTTTKDALEVQTQEGNETSQKDGFETQH